MKDDGFTSPVRRAPLKSHPAFTHGRRKCLHLRGQRLGQCSTRWALDGDRSGQVPMRAGPSLVCPTWPEVPGKLGSQEGQGPHPLPLSIFNPRPQPLECEMEETTFPEEMGSLILPPCNLSIPQSDTVSEQLRLYNAVHSSIQIPALPPMRTGIFDKVLSSSLV